MNIKTFENELNPEFINKAKNIFTIARTKNNLVKLNNKEYEFNTISNISKVRLDNNLNVLDSSCNCKSKYLYCEHTVATFFAIKEYLIKGECSYSSNNEENIYNYINDLDSIALYNPAHIFDDLKKLLKIINKEENKKEFLKYYLTKINEKYTNKEIFINQISSLMRQINYDLLLIFLKTLNEEKYNLSYVLSNAIQQGLNEDTLKLIFNDLKEELLLDILENPILCHFQAFDKALSSFNFNQKEYLYYSIVKMIINQKYDSYLINKFINNYSNNFTLIDNILYSLLDTKINHSLNEMELDLIIKYALKYCINIQHLYNNNLISNELINKNLNNLSLSSLNKNDFIYYNSPELIKNSINSLIENDLVNNNYNYPLVAKNLSLLSNKIKDLCIFEINHEKYEALLKYLIDSYLINNKYFKKIEDAKYIYFSINNARVYLIYMYTFKTIVKPYDYQLEPIDPFEYEELNLPYDLLDIYDEYLLDIKNLIPTIQKENKLKQLTNFQNYLLSSLISNEIKHNLKLELTLNTKKKYIKKEDIILRIKIGNNKYYYVNNLNQFFNNIKYNKTQTFGKNNNLNLSINNFDDYSKNLISELASLINDSSSKDLVIDSNIIQRIFDVSKGKMIDFTYKGISYDLIVSKNELEPQIKIDKNGVLSSDELSNNSIIISGWNSDYLLDFKNLVISKLNYKNEKIKNVIYFLIKNNNNFETEDIKEKFNEIIYPLIYDSSNIDEEYKLNNPIKLLEINCYLDINEDNIISAESKYFYDNQEVHTFDEITLEKVNNYTSLLKLLGFNEDNLIIDSDVVGDFLKTDLSSLKEIANVYISEDLSQKKIVSFNKYNIYLRQNNNMLNVIFDQSQFSDEELYDILKAYKRKKKYAFLKGQVIEIDEKVMNEITHAIDDFNLDEKHLSKEVNNPFYNILKINNYYELNSFEIEDKLSTILNDIKNYKESNFKPNSQLSSIMRPYQIEAYKWLKTLNKYNLGGILADDMGLGKTIETIALLDSSISSLPSLIVSPKSLIYNWERELTKWPTSLIPYVINGNKHERERILKENFKSGNVFIISYDTLRNDLELFEDKTFNYAILDEAQTIKNMQALKTKSVKKITAEHRLVLTGTPIENSVADLWSIFDFLMPNYLFNYDRFRYEIEKGILMNDDEAYKRIIQKTKPFILRRTKKDVLKDLPDKVEETILINMNSDQRKIYDAHLLQVKRTLKSEENNRIQVLSMLTRLRQLCISPSLVYENNIDAEKINYTMYMINNLLSTDHKVLIFSQFVSALNLIQNELNKENIPYYLITGDTSPKKRLEMSIEFNKESSKEKVFLISLKAGGTGLNLVGADTVIHLDPWWNVAIEDQASDRAHRIGQERKVTVFKLVMKNSIEEKVVELQKNKKEIAERIISNKENEQSNLTYEDYEYLLS